MILQSMSRRLLLWSSLSLVVVQGWSPYIHIVAMRLALRHMDPEAIVALDTVLSEPKWAARYPHMTDLTKASVFADVILFDDHVKQKHFEPPAVGEWHYTDVSIAGPGGEAKAQPSSVLERVSGPGNPYENNFNAAFPLEKTIRDWDASESPWYLNFLLRYFIHSLTDSHQPMHCSSAVSPRHEHGDKGGLRVRFERSCVYRNLHRLWDFAANLFPNRCSWTPKNGPFTSEFEAQLEHDVESLLSVEKVTQDELIDWELLESLSYADFKQYVSDNYLMRQIIDETSRVAEKYTRNGLEIKRGRTYLAPSEEYLEQARSVAATQIAKASGRLARFLNILGRKLLDDGVIDKMTENRIELTGDPTGGSFRGSDGIPLN